MGPEYETPPIKLTISGTGPSNGVYVNNKQQLALIFPSNWTTSTVTFEVSTDSITWYPLYNMLGLIVTPSMPANSALVLDAPDFLPFTWFRISSSTSQSSQRIVELVPLKVV